MKEGFQNQKVHSGVCQQTNLLGDQVAHVARRRRTFPLEELRPRHRPCNQGTASRHFARNAHGGDVDGLGLFSVSGSMQLFPGSEEGECLQHLRSRVEKFAMQLAQGIRMLDGYFGSECSAAFARPDLFASRAAVHPAAALQFNEVSSITQYNALLCDSFEYVFSWSHKRSLPCCPAVVERRRSRLPATL